MKKDFVSFHGDRDWSRIASVPKGAKPLGEFKEFVDARGETTGHRHLVRSPKSFQVYDYQGKYVYDFREGAEVSHEEHRTIPFRPGIYIVEQETEESPQDGLVHPVDD